MYMSLSSSYSSSKSKSDSETTLVFTTLIADLISPNILSISSSGVSGLHFNKTSQSKISNNPLLGKASLSSSYVSTFKLITFGIIFLFFFLIADTEHFTPLAAALPGSAEEREATQAGNQVTEVYPLTLFAVSGMMIFPIASDLIMLFVALEMLSLPLYLMAGLSRRRRLASQESALKYFLLGSFASAFFLFGAAYLHGYSGSITFTGIRESVIGGSGNDVLLLIGMAFLTIGLLFKVGAVPFHSWSPVS